MRSAMFSRGFQLRSSITTSIIRTISSKSPGVVVLGASVMDCVAYVERMPVKGETILGGDFKMGFGGKGANQAVMAGILGDSTAMITKVNPNDAFGKEMKNNFLQNGVSVEHGARHHGVLFKSACRFSLITSLLSV